MTCNHEFIDIIGFSGKSLGRSCKKCDIREEDVPESEKSISMTGTEIWHREYLCKIKPSRLGKSPLEGLDEVQDALNELYKSIVKGE